MYRVCSGFCLRTELHIPAEIDNEASKSRNEERKTRKEVRQNSKNEEPKIVENEELGNIKNVNGNRFSYGNFFVSIRFHRRNLKR